MTRLTERNKSKLSLTKASLFYWFVMGVGFLVVSGITSQKVGNDAWLAGFVALMICAIPGWLALWISGNRTDDIKGLNRIMLGMLVSMFVPLVGLIVIKKNFEELVAGAVLGQIMAFFLIMLPTETLLTLQVKTKSDLADKEVAHHG